MAQRHLLDLDRDYRIEYHIAEGLRAMVMALELAIQPGWPTMYDAQLDLLRGGLARMRCWGPPLEPGDGVHDVPVEGEGDGENGEAVGEGNEENEMEGAGEPGNHVEVIVIDD
jgi:hypothetical protein